MSFKFTKICPKHPELLGKRYGRTYNCVGCISDRTKEKNKTEEMRQYYKNHYALNREKRLKQIKDNYQRNKEKTLQYQKAYRATNRGETNALRSKHRAVKRNAIPRNWVGIRERIDGIYTCAAILRSLGHKVQVDHILPLCGVGLTGLHIPNNLQILNSSDNSSKRHSYSGDWMSPDGSVVFECKSLTKRQLVELESTTNVSVVVRCGDD